MNDLVSRQAILALPRRITRTLGGVIVAESVDIEDIKKLPPAQLEQSDIKEMAVDIGYLRDWYQSSVLEDEWPDRYIEEVYHDFYLIPKQENEKNESDVDT